MSFESFLQFWSVYNRQIIEFVFVFTFVLILFIIYRQFFAKPETVAGAGGHAPVSIDTSEIEEKLRKILENQGAVRAATSAEPGAAPAAAAPAAESTNASGAAAVVDTAELEKLKNDVKERDKIIEELKKNVGAAAPASGKEDTKKFEDKIKELEGRLQEYEIISEDIADLSFYKEENARLQKEISSGGGGAKAAAAPAAPAAPVAPVAAVAPAAAPPESAPAPVAAAPAPAIEAPQLEDVTVPQPETPPPPAEPAPGMLSINKPDAPQPPKEAEAVVDDDILKEFAAAVEGQKAAEAASAAETTPPAAKTGPQVGDALAAAMAPKTPTTPTPEAQAVDPQKLEESKELMGEFENFIKKG